MHSLHDSLKKFSPPVFPALAVTFSVSYLVNLLWEVAHSLLYNWTILPLHNSVSFYVPKILGATLGDAVIITLLFALLSFYRSGFSWMRFTRRGDLLFLLLGGLCAAVFIELRAKAAHSWTYAITMPLIFGIGFTPLIQLAVTSLLTLYIVKRWYYGSGA